ncbi:hypothetical protein SAMN05660841_00378 [Sphingobacterium nematocida]|uniref:Uncharacterized protein n=1 Tax=Sphingobacterium nematocida TaxID=1513896 RepID=A0A1T5B186_9SPHI|nr:hypothetical protein [Sphingobacterium nematocida]SKB41006.1 hypothetical protein SAMN05660841_00378 [Sphingobacterium nematocida]
MKSLIILVISKCYLYIELELADAWTQELGYGMGGVAGRALYLTILFYRVALMNKAIEKAARKITDNIPDICRMVMRSSWHDILKDVSG